MVAHFEPVEATLLRLGQRAANAHGNAKLLSDGSHRRLAYRTADDDPKRPAAEAVMLGQDPGRFIYLIYVEKKKN